MLTIDAFAKAYSMSSSSVRRHIRQGHLRSELLNGRRVIDPDEAERWLSEQGWRTRARNISRPDLPPVVLNECDLRTLSFGPLRCWEDIPLTEVRRVERLRALGFQCELIESSTSPPYYRLKDVIKLTQKGYARRIGPGAALGVSKPVAVRDPDPVDPDD